MALLYCIIYVYRNSSIYNFSNIYKFSNQYAIICNGNGTEKMSMYTPLTYFTIFYIYKNSRVETEWIKLIVLVIKILHFCRPTFAKICDLARNKYFTSIKNQANSID